MKDLTGGLGVDYAFDAIGGAKTMETCIDAIAPGGHAVMVGMPAFTDRAQINPFQVVFQEKKITGTYYGSIRPPIDFGVLADLDMDKRINLDALISRTYKFDEINEGFRLLTHGRGRARRHRVLRMASRRLRTGSREAVRRSRETVQRWEEKSRKPLTTATKLKTVHLQLPATTEDLAALELGTVVYLRAASTRRARASTSARWRTAPACRPRPKSWALPTSTARRPPALNPDGSATVGAVTATASFRFAKWLDGWFKLSAAATSSSARAA